ncbi:MAG: metallophosphoesterase [Vitreimonas sp.]
MSFLRSRARQASSANFVDGRVGYAIGDIHGRSDLLVELLAVLENRAPSEVRDGVHPVVVFLGDYVDRGPNSAGVIDLLLKGAPFGYERRFLKGNHEQSMLAFMEAPLENRAWVLQGGAETLRSYGVTPPPPVGARDEDWVRVSRQLSANLPSAHLDFLNGLERYLVFGDYAFVHAGVDHSRSLEQQTDADLYWSRQRFLASKKRFSHVVVHGHTPADRPYVDDRRIGIDTGAYASGMLSAARFEGTAVTFLSAMDRVSQRRKAQAL